MEGKNSRVRYNVSTMDRISNLPWAILDDILGRLPIGDAVRTSILSRKWRYNWVNLSKLNFDNFCCCVLGSRADTDRFAKFIYHVLLSHCGQIQIFNFFPWPCERLSESDLDNLINFLSRKDRRDYLKEIVLRPPARPGRKYKVSSCLFSCQQLTRLYISDVLLGLPSDFTVFRNLVSLQLQRFATNSTDQSIDAESFANLIRHCPVLEKLDVKSFKMLAPLVIQAPNLQYLSLDGMFRAIVFENCLALKDITLDNYDEPTIDQPWGKQRCCNLFKYLGNIACLESLVLSGPFLEYLDERDASEIILPASNRLRVLELRNIFLRKLAQVKVALTLFKLFPNIEELHISAVSGDDHAEESDEAVDSLSQCSCWFNAVQIVKINIFCGCKDVLSEIFFRPESELIKFVLLHSPILEKMRIIGGFSTMKHEKMLMKSCLFFERASKKAKISFNFF